MQICLVSTIGYPNRTKIGGVPTCTRNMAHALVAQGVDVSVVTKRTDGAPFLESDGPVNIFSLTLGNIHYYMTRVAPLGMWPRIVKSFEWGRNIGQFITNLHRDGKVDLVVYSNVWLEALRHPKHVPFAVRMDTPLFAARPVPGCGDQTGWKTLERLERRVVQSADAVICLSGSAAERIQSEYQLSQSKIVIMPNPVDVHRFRPNGSHKGEPRRIFHPGPRLDDWQKGTRVLLQAMEAVVEKMPEARLILAGRGTPDLSSASKRVKESIEILGWLDGDALAQQYALADVTIVPSLNYDSFPTVCLESLAAGAPVIGSSIAGIPEIVRHRETGIIVRPDNATELGRAIIETLSDSSMLAEMRVRAREAAETNYSFDSVGKKMSLLCDRLVKEKAKTAPLVNCTSHS